jgi:hypothetical protein
LHWAFEALHWKAPHEMDEPGTQAPAPSQVGAGRRATDSWTLAPPTVPEIAGAHEALPHVVPTLASWQPLLPLHLPVLPQTLLALTAQVVVSLGVPPEAIELHVPTFPVSVQLWQAPEHALLQHTPSGEQKPLVQSEFALHDFPLACLSPHVLLVVRQVSPLLQSAFEVQVVRHDGLVALHT